MLSIIICSRRQHLEKKLLENIEATVGCEHEIIPIDNSANSYSIFEAYNLGLERSKGKLVCFMHDDVKIHTHSWGELAQNIFREKPELGLLGVAGSKLKTKMPSSWWDCPEDLKSLHLIQHLNNGKSVKWDRGFSDSPETEVVLIDGVFMLMRKNIGIKFNETLKGFHNYDMNICLEALNKGCRIQVTNSILIEHFSIGSIDRYWVSSTLQFQKIYGRYLPLLEEKQVNPKLLHKLEVENGVSFINKLLEFGFKKEAFFFWKKLFFLQPFSGVHVKLFRNFRMH